MSDFMIWLYLHYIKPYLDTVPADDYNFHMDMIHNELGYHALESYEKNLEFTAIHAFLLGRGYAWLDTGTMDSLVEAATFVQTVEQRQGIKISAPEEIAYKYGWITKEKLLESAARYGKSPYGQHLKNVADDKLQY